MFPAAGAQAPADGAGGAGPHQALGAGEAPAQRIMELFLDRGRAPHRGGKGNQKDNQKGNQKGNKGKGKGGVKGNKGKKGKHE